MSSRPSELLAKVALSQSKEKKASVMAHTCYPNTWEVEAGIIYLRLSLS